MLAQAGRRGGWPDRTRGAADATFRDPRRFGDPATFDVARANARHHLAFGRGIHTCPSAPLARAEARVCIERILDGTAAEAALTWYSWAAYQKAKPLRQAAADTNAVIVSGFEMRG